MKYPRYHILYNFFMNFNAVTSQNNVQRTSIQTYDALMYIRSFLLDSENGVRFRAGPFNMADNAMQCHVPNSLQVYRPISKVANQILSSIKSSLRHNVGLAKFWCCNFQLQKSVMYLLIKIDIAIVSFN